MRNNANNLKPIPASALTSVTAGGSGDATKVTGTSIERSGFYGGLLNIVANVTIADTKTLAYAVEIQESPDNSTWATAVVLQAETVVFTSDGGDTNTRVNVPLVVDLNSYGKYVRFNITPNLSASGTDTASVTADLIVTDSNESPLGLAFTGIE